jgi:hypothetical protein
MDSITPSMARFTAASHAAPLAITWASTRMAVLSAQ